MCSLAVGSPFKKRFISTLPEDFSSCFGCGRFVSGKGAGVGKFISGGEFCGSVGILIDDASKIFSGWVSLTGAENFSSTTTGSSIGAEIFSSGWKFSWKLTTRGKKNITEPTIAAEQIFLANQNFFLRRTAARSSSADWKRCAGSSTVHLSKNFFKRPS